MTGVSGRGKARQDKIRQGEACTYITYGSEWDIMMRQLKSTSLFSYIIKVKHSQESASDSIYRSKQASKEVQVGYIRHPSFQVGKLNLIEPSIDSDKSLDLVATKYSL